MHCLTHQQIEGGCVCWPITGQQSLGCRVAKTTSANFRFWPDQAKTSSRVRDMHQSQPIPRTAAQSKCRCEAKCAAMSDWPVRLCLLTYHGKLHLVRVMWSIPHLPSSFMLLARFLLWFKMWTMWSEANQNSITWTLFHVSSSKTSMKMEISSLILVTHRK